PQVLAERVGVELSSPVGRVSDRGDRVELAWGDRAEDFDACVLACELPVAAAICPDRADILRPLDEAIGYTSCITVGIGTLVPPDSPAMLVALPPCEDAEVALMFLDHNKC